jgi:hypothetical protein
VTANRFFLFQGNFSPIVLLLFQEDRMYRNFSGGMKSSRPGEPLARGWFNRCLALIDAYPLHILGLISVLAVVVSLFLNRNSLPPVPECW